MKVHSSHLRGLGLVETAMSILLVSGLFAVAFHGMSGAAMSRAILTDQAKGQALATGLLSEIMFASYREPGTVNTLVWGREAGELDGNRSTWDDVDDYHGLVENPPSLRDATTITEGRGWERRVELSYLNPRTLLPALIDTGAMFILVAVFHQGKEVGRAVAVRTGAPG